MVKSFKFIMVILAVVMAVSLSLAGCDGQQTTTTSKPATTTTTSKPATTTTTTTTSSTQPTTTGTQGGTITTAGSTTVQPVAETIAHAYMAAHAGINVVIQGGGSSAGVKAAAEKIADIGMASREIKESEKSLGLAEYILARDGIAIVVSSSQTVSNLTTEQVRQIFSGEITNWSQVGGANRSINVVAREEGSGTRAAFEEMVMGTALITARAILQPSTGAVKTTVTGDADAIGFISFGYIDSTVKALSIDGIAATVNNAKSGVYPIVRPLLLLTNGQPTGMVKEFIDFCLSPQGQQIVEAEGYITVAPTVEMKGTITTAGSTTVQPVAEELAHLFTSKYPAVNVVVQGGGSSAGVKAAAEKIADIGMASRELKASEQALGIVEHVLAQDGIAIIVSSSQTVSNLTTEQVRQIFSGEITNWSQVGGANRSINVVAREEGSGTRAAFEEMVMGTALITARAILQPSTGAVKTTVTGDADAIGFISFGYIDTTVKALSIDGIAATVANAKTGVYPIVRPLLLLTNGQPTGMVKEFIDFCLGTEGQAIVAEDYIPVN